MGHSYHFDKIVFILSPLTKRSIKRCIDLCKKSFCSIFILETVLIDIPDEFRNFLLNNETKISLFVYPNNLFTNDSMNEIYEKLFNDIVEKKRSGEKLTPISELYYLWCKSGIQNIREIRDFGVVLDAHMAYSGFFDKALCLQKNIYAKLEFKQETQKWTVIRDEANKVSNIRLCIPRDRKLHIEWKREYEERLMTLMTQQIITCSVQNPYHYIKNKIVMFNDVPHAENAISLLYTLQYMISRYCKISENEEPICSGNLLEYILIGNIVNYNISKAIYNENEDECPVPLITDKKGDKICPPYAYVEGAITLDEGTGYIDEYNIEHEQSLLETYDSVYRLLGIINQYKLLNKISIEIGGYRAITNISESFNSNVSAFYNKNYECCVSLETYKRRIGQSDTQDVKNSAKINRQWLKEMKRRMLKVPSELKELLEIPDDIQVNIVSKVDLELWDEIAREKERKINCMIERNPYIEAAPIEEKEKITKDMENECDKQDLEDFKDEISNLIYNAKKMEEEQREELFKEIKKVAKQKANRRRGRIMNIFGNSEEQKFVKSEILKVI